MRGPWRPLLGTSQFPLRLLIKASHKFGPVSGVERESLPLNEKSNKSYCKSDGGIYGFFHNLSSPPNLRFIFLVLLAHHGLLGAVFHIISQSEMQDGGFLPLCRACLVGYHNGRKDINELSVLQAIQCLYPVLPTSSLSKVSHMATPDFKGVGVEVLSCAQKEGNSNICKYIC